MAATYKKVFEKFKRVIDIILSIVLFVPLIILYPFVAILIKISSKGPIFYRQKRGGKNSKIFEIIKFRSMIMNAETNGAQWASKNDGRATWIGNILRIARIDELPQVWNVLKGDLSFVGPRPERPEFYGKLQKEIPFYEERYLVKPGLTGWAQIKHGLDFRGGLTIKDTAEKLQHDLYYIKNRSPLFDLGIILKTINILLKKTFR